jgi:hypothetical protein
MGLKCRLLGHSYGDPEIEREREESGDEVVVSIREVQVCARCGKEMVVSENKEVTSIRTPEEVGLEDDGRAAETPPTSEAQSAARDAPAESNAPAGANAPTEPNAPADRDAGSPIQEAEPDVAPDDGVSATADETPDDDFEPPQDPEEDDAVILEDETTERDDTQWPEETETDPSEAAEHSAALEEERADEDVTDDAEFIDADEEVGAGPDAGERGHGEWPAREDHETEGSESSAAWPEHDSDDEGFDAQPSDGSPSEVSFGGGLTPEMNGHAAAETTEEYVSTDDGFTRADEQSELETNVPDDRVEFYCPNCDHARTAGASSMRAGDICPQCKQGYIAEREL